MGRLIVLRYPYQMSRRILALLSFPILFVLPGCASPEQKACEAAQQTAADYLSEAKSAGDKIDTVSDGTITPENSEVVGELLQAMNDLTLKSYKVIVNNQSCFSPKEVVEAQTNLGD